MTVEQVGIYEGGLAISVKEGLHERMLLCTKYEGVFYELYKMFKIWKKNN